MKCKAKWCDLESGHKGKCLRLTVVNGDKPVVNLGAFTPGSGVRIACAPFPTTATKRQTAWQQANRERYNTKMRDYMKRKRAESRGRA